MTLPKKSNLLDKGCSPVSSNCVVWQGPCLDCINLQTGDTVSDVIYNLATELCDLKEQLDLSDLDLKCLFEACELCPDPEYTLSSVLTLLINKVCDLETIIESLTGGEPTPDDPMTIAACFQTLDPLGNPILTLPRDEYIQAIAAKVCTLNTTVTSHTTELDDHETRITALEDAPDPTFELPTVVPSCIYGVDTTPKEMDEFLITLEEKFCELKEAIGEPAEILLAAAKQCVNLNTSEAFSVSGTMSTLEGWKTVISNLSDSINNMWLTVCDMRTAVSDIQECCSLKCSDITVDFYPYIADNGHTINLYFNGYMHIPSGVTDCEETGSQLTISDGVGGTHILNIPLVAASASLTPTSIDITTTPLNPTGNYTFTLESCLTDGDVICNKTIIRTAVGTPLSCEAPSNVIATLV
jgi:hypothetical protein